MTQRICTQPECERTTLARGLCAPHYSTWHRSQRKYPMTCGRCGRQFMADRPTRVTCSRTCGATNGSDAAKEVRPVPVAQLQQCAECHSLYVADASSTRKTCSEDCVSAALKRRGRASRSPLRRAIEDSDHAATLSLIHARTQPNDSGCHIWQGRLDDGYPVINIGTSRALVHRLVLEAKHQAPLGVQAAHHKCATPACVNPDHLQPVTHRDNVAEMLARQTYLARIAELEAALTEASPHHPTLNRIRTA